MAYQKEAATILKAVGGEENIEEMAHCATRLRLTLKDEGKIDEETLSQIDVVKGTFSTSDQYQIIIGSGTVNKVFQAVQTLMKGDTDEHTHQENNKQKKKGHPLQRFVKMLSDIFVPIIPAIVAGGLLMGLNNILTAKGIFSESQSVVEMYPHFAEFASMINIFASAPFALLPILIGFSAAKRFGGNAFLGAALGAIMVHPALMNGYAYPEALTNGDPIPRWHILGLSIAQVGYQGQVLPTLVATYILAQLEKGLRRVVPTVLDNLLTPLFAILITAFLTFLFVGPLTRTAGFWLTDGLTWLYETGGAVGGFLFGLFYAPIVITGMHHSFIAIETALIADSAKTGGSFIFPIAAMSNMAQGAAALAAFFLIKQNQKLKGVASAAGVSAVLGITEPAMFGVNLKLRYPFIGAMTGSALGSAYVSFFKVKATALGAAGIPGVISIAPGSWTHYIIGMCIAFIGSFVITLILSKQKKYQGLAE